VLCGLALIALALTSCAHPSAASSPSDVAAAATPSAVSTPTPTNDPNNGRTGQDLKPPVPLMSGVHPVKLAKTDGKWQLTRDGQPYFIKGVGGDYSRDTLTAMGGNSVRLWAVDAKTAGDLNECAKHNVTVALGYWVGHKKVGYHADDPAAVAAHLEEFKRVVKIYKDHPAVLVWAIGNEMENGNDTPALWQSIEDMAKAAHEIDPNHPTMTVVAEVGGRHVAMIHELCPDIDIVGINSYAGARNVGDRYLGQVPAGKAKPYVITEFGPPGQWEWGKTRFGAVNELTSTEKATWYRAAYEKTVLGHPGECLGAYAFLWGYKPEATITWYGMFLPDGAKTAAVDVMQEMWSGKKTDTPCPVVKKIAITGANEVGGGDTVKATVDASDPGGGKLKYDWILHREMASYDTTEATAPITEAFPKALEKNGEPEASFKMPAGGGVYRIYCYVRNERGGAAVGTVPVQVRGG
jgi:hypothetical protein